MKKISVLRFIISLASILIFSSASYAMHPLITDEAETNGKGKFEVEINSEYSYDKEKIEGETVRETEIELETELTYGITDDIDIKLMVPYTWKKEEEDGEKDHENGFSDISLSLKWRFFEKERFSLALKPFITLPTGDEEKELGTGRVSCGLFLIASTEIERLEFYTNLGYMRNENRIGEREDIWHASIATEYEATENLSLVANLGVEKNRDRESHTNPAFIIGGIVYSISEHTRIDCGVKWGLNKPETDYALLAGIAFEY
ncbi:MAG: transporter [Nitrospirota bacterium]